MSSLFHCNRKSIPNMRKQAARPRRVLRSLVMAIVGLGLMSPQPVGARPDAAWQFATLTVTPGGDLTLCKGEKKTVLVTLGVRTARDYNLLEILGVGGRYTYPPNQRISVQSSNRRAATTSPSGNRLTSIRVPDGVRAGAFFEISGNDLGRSTITFSDGGHFYTGSPYDRPRADPVTVTVTVKKCQFKIVYFNTWLVADGFTNPRMTSSFSATITPDDAGTIPAKNVRVENEVHPTSNPSSKCVFQDTAFVSNARVSGDLDWNTDTLHIYVAFDEVKARYDWDCESVYVPVEVHKEMNGYMTYLEQWFPAEGYRATPPQTLSAAHDVTHPAALVVAREYVE